MSGDALATITGAATNNGTMTVTAGQLDLSGGLTNISGSTLTGGTYRVLGTAGGPSAGLSVPGSTVPCP